MEAVNTAKQNKKNEEEMERTTRWNIAAGAVLFALSVWFTNAATATRERKMPAHTLLTHLTQKYYRHTVHGLMWHKVPLNDIDRQTNKFFLRREPKIGEAKNCTAYKLDIK